ncbi:phage tail protein [Sphingomonas sp. DT-207]|uniref:phage tail protein n=1 Tax=Sphingomonas sp. DT-207 TaxID=3396167 RepID=UPI003F1D2096
MAEPFLGEIMQVGFSFAPRGWTTCQGQLLSIAQQSALFSLLGTTFGGNGQTTFGIPDARGRAFVGTGQRPGGGTYDIGQMAGTENMTLTTANMPMHTHAAAFAGNAATPTATATLSVMTGATTQTNVPTEGAMLSQPANIGPQPVKIFVPAGTTGTPVNLGGIAVSGGEFTPTGNVTVASSGGSTPFSIMQPYLGITTVIALDGIFPSRN